MNKTRPIPLRRFVEISQATDVESFQQLLVRMANHCGFGLMSAMMVVEDMSGQGRHRWNVVDKRPPSYLKLYRDQARNEKCPVIRRLKQLSIPFIYNQSTYVEDGLGHQWEEQAPHGYREGIAVALHLPHHRHFALGFDGDAPLPKDGTALMRLLADLQLVAVYAHAAAERLLLPSLLNESDKPPKLTPRELEVLKWTLDGKTAWETAAILGISERTAVLHITQAMRKLETVNKHQAALKALRLGLIG